VMRCLTLADALRARGAQCRFVSRCDAGDVVDLIRQRGYWVASLPAAARVGGEEDASETRAALVGVHTDWLIVDHYRLGESWEVAIRPSVHRLLVIDDLGRPHQCDMLLDQNLETPIHARYRERLGEETPLLLGPQFALVRPEFAALRSQALARRDGSLARLLVSFGGSDAENLTVTALAALQRAWQSQWSVDVVIGSSNPNIESVEAACRKLPQATLHVQTARMAQLMVAADCAINAGGSTTWERCCLGLPGLVTVVSDDQVAIADSVARAGGHVLVGSGAQVGAEDYVRAIGALTRTQLIRMAQAAAVICDGLGAERVAQRLH
jgi:UDP-2,4-diacetamido-2,4,6-trideoxy-beta-L-altropyranose hydrolase